MKLLGERYFKGRISFEGSPSPGTLFTAPLFKHNCASHKLSIDKSRIIAEY
jgi:hypothetical protein